MRAVAGIVFEALLPRQLAFRTLTLTCSSEGVPHVFLGCLPQTGKCPELGHQKILELFHCPSRWERGRWNLSGCLIVWLTIGGGGRALTTGRRAERALRRCRSAWCILSASLHASFATNPSRESTDSDTTPCEVTTLFPRWWCLPASFRICCC